MTVDSSTVVAIIVAMLGSQWFGNWVQNTFSNTSNKVMLQKLKELDYKVDKNQAETYRTRILRFNGEIKRGVHHDEEEFNDAIEAINGYEDFCKRNPNYPNNKAVLAIKNIKHVYEKAYENNDL